MTQKGLVIPSPDSPTESLYVFPVAAGEEVAGKGEEERGGTG